ncbi:hypothetical protein SBOR_2371 [Sclerotinia borealis F-4128]|uniref:Uncharacterized protein n=1 Tax=Sclerotinia borealis (strain F-4128) TaxID=1432307 RepID=W9CMJ7_SCLBF|nr:hypothetical protein SBOR_2371 [Sclerotinia borealis F-4128]
MSSSSNTTTQQSRTDRAYSTSSSTSNSSITSGWLILNGHSSSTATTPTIESDNAFNPFLQLSPVTRGTSVVNQKFVATENAEDRQRLFLLRARDN